MLGIALSRRALRRATLVRLLQSLVAPVAIAAVAQACSVEPQQWTLRRGAPRGSTLPDTGDPCAPGRSPAMSEDPTATCALKTEYHVPDLTEPGGLADASGGVSPMTLRPLDAMDGAEVASKSCAAKKGPGIDTCGPNGNEDCCRVAPVPAGKAGTIEVEGFDLGVYEVTSGRFAAFVAQTGGDLRNAAATGGWAGWDPSWTDKLPASRDAVDVALGPACQMRSNVREYGALTWPSADTEAAVAELIDDDNDEARDIRADATPARLYQKPINCVTYWVAAAFCAWEGGRLPSPDEWAYAAIGGAEQREYAWGDGGLTGDKLVTELNHDEDDQRFSYPEGFPFGGNGLNAYHIAPPGRKPAGVARWGHHDMAGNVLEWTSRNVGGTLGQVRGGSWEGHPERNSFAHENYPLDRSYGSLGFRCASGAPAPAEAPKPPPVAAKVVVVHRAFDAKRGDHLLGATADEGAPAFASEGVAFRLFGDEPVGGAPLHRCLTAAGYHFLSNDPKCEGNAVEGRLGWALAAAADGTLPLYRCVGPGGSDHLSTVTPEECTKAGYQVEGTQGFVHGPPPADFIESLYRAALGRAPDAPGHAYWVGSALARGCSAPTLASVIESFYLSNEFLGRPLDNPQRVDLLYRGGLGRAPEPAAAAGGPADLDSKKVSWSELVASVARSPEAAGLAPARCSP